MAPVAPPLRKIVHVDMDAFYASVEQRDRPELRGRPVVVGGAPNSRGVVCTASYEARVFGIHSAMPTAQAYRLCPQAVFLSPDFRRYQAVSRQIRAVFLRYTERVEPLSLDEAYLDVTENKRGLVSATHAAQAIRAEIRAETGLTASAGVAPNKFLAKVASDLDKPDGLTVIPPERVRAFVATLPVRKVPGVGRVTEKRLEARGIVTCGDFLRYSPAQLEAWFGSAGAHYRRLALGVDHRAVESARERKSFSVEDTFARDIYTRAEAVAVLERLAGTLEERLRQAGARGRTVVLKAKYRDFRQVTRSRTVERPVGERHVLASVARELLTQVDLRRGVRLLGIGVSKLEEGAEQLLLPFYEAMLRGAEP